MELILLYIVFILLPMAMVYFSTGLIIVMAGQNLVSYCYTGVEWNIYHDEEYGSTKLWANQTYYHDVDDAIDNEFILKK